MINTAPRAAYSPIIFGNAYVGPAMHMRQGQYTLPPVLPSAAMQAGASSENVAFSGAPVPTATSETGNPFHPTKSPLIFALLFLAAGILMLQHIHYK